MYAVVIMYGQVSPGGRHESGSRLVAGTNDEDLDTALSVVWSRTERSPERNLLASEILLLLSIDVELFATSRIAWSRCATCCNKCARLHQYAPCGLHRRRVLAFKCFSITPPPPRPPCCAATTDESPELPKEDPQGGGGRCDCSCVHMRVMAKRKNRVGPQPSAPG